MVSSSGSYGDVGLAVSVSLAYAGSGVIVTLVMVGGVFCIVMLVDV